MGMANILGNHTLTDMGSFLLLPRTVLGHRSSSDLWTSISTWASVTKVKHSQIMYPCSAST